LLLNLVLLALAALAAWHLREQWLAARARERTVLQQAVRPVPPPPISPLPAAPKVQASGYIEIAEKMLFTKDRNPVVLVEVAPPPPPKPMPPLPVLHGVMDLGDGPTAILSPKAGAPHRDFRPGEQIGEFKLVAIDQREIVLEWDGKQVSKRLEDLLDRTGPPQREAAEARTSTPAPAPAQAQPMRGALGPGADAGKGMRACQPGDSTPPGTIVDGLRKVVSRNPFGQTCLWEPVK
jgi:hypothetical protein